MNTDTDRLITVAIHTFEKATVLRSILEHEGIPVALQNVNLVQPVVSSGVRVRIHESDLPKALRIIENVESLAEAPLPAETEKKGAEKVLVPIDFSQHSDHACSVAFRYAADYGAEIELLHAYVTPTIASNFQLTNSLDFEFDNLAEDELSMSIEEASQQKLDEYAAHLRSLIATGELPPVKFTTRLVDDVAEDAIIAEAKEIRPSLIVMGTRGAGRKEQDMIGSVTAEVLDSCRFPVFTVPDGMERLCRVTERCHVVFFCNFEQHDLLALDLFYRLFPKAEFDVTLVNVPSKKMPMDIESLGEGLLDYCRRHLPRFSFTLRTVAINDMEAEFAAIKADRAIDFIAVPNKRRNIFSRLFNPGLAHRMLFHTDIPMVVLPV